MKRILLDTHALLWWLTDDQNLGVKAREIIADPRNQVFVSTASTWEISIKRALGKLKAPEDMDSLIEDEGFLPLPISLYHGDQAGLLPEHHKDPFDRMLIAQAQAEGLTIITCDEKFPPYKIRLIDAGN
ncbi:type II toxin-antitoxin system VapC family toxin [Catenovulum sp. SX2]|uniref:type II toxin-antitoxin system VapC family toxin n=1 Tax=Catenovulum sp. SX2 TaxID=3398614 RepID=UPI003F83F37E